MSISSDETSKLLTLAEEYVRLSNEHDVEACLKQLNANASYQSTTVGAYEGIDAISSMMKTFFSNFPSVHWDVKEYKISQGNRDCVEFEFVRTLKKPEGLVREEGKEWIEFSEQGGKLGISKISVETFKKEIIA
ncbi:hypothetical protein GUITHDRAFT_102332 [Guillardia theta CCMP2712]|uniref:SnoaL-like domain-containing protein n=2 Tax=Guillardia theta TaxID=55529 RepID=L1JTH4_GUITC|nr:hypothetical protein GUITHDRAFT_102332 [Guillardia theta CCMP2712]EKX51727.1 hypothetical protein GUITHDRAFT_102332 [Guillardia theta CCMP2712]|eukprot:XP_005838707.1 hypothetical protein GUITHDRAFT_102332 [Guillardia theta CCMP2712]